MSTHDAKPSQRMKSGRRRGLMGMALALLMLLPTLAISSASAAPTSPAARATGKFNVRATYFWPGANNGRQMSAGQKVDWRGYVSPYISSSRVVIQYKVGSRCKAVWFRLLQGSAAVQLTRGEDHQAPRVQRKQKLQHMDRQSRIYHGVRMALSDETPSDHLRLRSGVGAD